MAHNNFFDTRFDIDSPKYQDLSTKKSYGPGTTKSTKDMLLELAVALGDPRVSGYYEASRDAKNRRTPAGYTYLAQFVAHDLNHTDLARTGFVSADSNAKEQTAILELAHLYGEGPSRSAVLFVPEQGTNGRWRLAIGPALSDKAGKATVEQNGKTLTGDVFLAAEPDRDLPRLLQCPGIDSTNAKSQPNGDAVIADPRNDENLIISQLTCLFIRAHNRIANRIAERENFDNLRGAERAKTGRAIFPIARGMMMYAYHRIIVHDLLNRLLDQEVFERLAKDVEAHTADGFRYIEDPRNGFAIPLTFSRAVFRVGHVMAQNKYRFNSTFSDDSLDEGWELKRLIDVIRHPGGKRRERIFPVRAKWIIDWHRFFFQPNDLQPDEDRLMTGERVNFSHPIGLSYPQSLIDYEDGVFATEDGKYSVPYMDFARGFVDGVPTAENIFGLHPHILPEGKRLTKRDIRAALQPLPLDEETKSALVKQTPLLLYILIEAQQFSNGESLGPLGSTIVGEVLMGAVMSAHLYGTSEPDQDPAEIRSGIADNWLKYFDHPEPATMSEFVAFAEGDLTPTT